MQPKGGLDENGSRRDALRSLSRRLWKTHEAPGLFVTDCSTKCINHACINTLVEAYVYVTQENDKKIIGINLGVVQHPPPLRAFKNGTQYRKPVFRKNESPPGKHIARSPPRRNFRFTDRAALLSSAHTNMQRLFRESVCL